MLHGNKQFENRNYDDYENYTTKPRRLYVSKRLEDLETTPPNIMALSRIESTTTSILSTTTAKTTTRKVRPRKRTKKLTTTSTYYDETTSSPIWQKTYQNRQENIIYTNNPILSQKVTSPDQTVVYYQNEKPKMSSRNQIFSNVPDSRNYQSSPSQNYRFNFKTGSGTKSFIVTDNGKPSVTVQGRNGYSTQMVQDGNNYKLIVYV